MSVRKEWMVKLSKIDQSLGIEPRHPHTLLEHTIENEIEQQNQIIKNSNYELGNEIKKSIENVSGTIEHGFDLMIESNNKNTEEIIDSIDNLSENIDSGFDQISEQLYGLNSSINRLSKINKQGLENVVRNLKSIESALTWNFSSIIELNRKRNNTLSQILQILNIPDIEKERKLKIEKGLEFYQKSYYNKEFFNYSKKYFEEALKMDELDYFVLHNLGLIHFFSKNHIDFEKAIHYFTKSAKFAVVDINTKPINYSNYSSSFTNNIDTLQIATYSYLYTARCYYLLGNYKEALVYVNEAYNLSPLNNEVAFDKAKISCINNQITQSVDVLDKLIDRDRFITLKILKDEDLITKKEIRKLLDTKKIQADKQVLDEYNTCINLVSKNSALLNELYKIKRVIDKDSFLDSKKALDSLIN